MIIKAVKRIFHSDKMCRSYSDLNFGVTFLEHSVVAVLHSVCRFYSDALSAQVHTHATYAKIKYVIICTFDSENRIFVISLNYLGNRLITTFRD